MTATDSDLYYDPFDFEIDVDPYPIFRRLREEQPLYYNERYDFYALSRFDDVDAALVDWETYSSAKSTLVELIKANYDVPRGVFIFSDPPEHTVHRGLLSRVFTPKKMNALEPQVREFCARSLDPLVGTGGFDFIKDLGAQMPMRTIGMLLGIPESQQQSLMDRFEHGLALKDGTMPDFNKERPAVAMDMFADFLDWRTKNPGDDIMSELIQAEYEDVDGERKHLTREEVLGYLGLLSGAGNETTARLIGWTGKVLADHPDQRRELVEDTSLIPGAIEELLRFETPSPVNSRYVTRDVEHYGRVVPAGSVMVLINGSANRDDRKFPNGDTFDIHRKIDRHASFGYGLHFCLGAALARLEGRVALDEVLKRFPTWDVDWENAVQAHTSVVRGWETLPVFTP